MTPEAFGRILAAAPEGPIGVAVSGGGDSLALLLMAQAWSQTAGRSIAAVTLDHHLRSGSAAEAAYVARICTERGIAHDTLHWEGWNRRGNLQDAARAARRRLIAEWALRRGMGAVALGHTLDDQAETFLLRLARGSGVDGLSAMATISRGSGMMWLRPMLDLRRDALRDFLRGLGVAWIDDPSNSDPVFDRVRAREAMGPLGALGLGAERLAATARRMGRARTALEAATTEIAKLCLVPGPAGDVALDLAPMAAAPEEIRLRVLAGALCWVAGARFRPRLATLEAAEAAILHDGIGRGVTLHGCVLRRRAGGVVIRREPAHAAGRTPLARGVWDDRWRIIGAAAAGLEIGALGVDGLAQRPFWRGSGLARETLLTTPALWRDDALVAALALDQTPAATIERISPLPPPWCDAELR